MTRRTATRILAVATLVMAAACLLCAEAAEGAEPLDVGGWRASSDAIHLHQYGTDLSCPPAGCPTTMRGGSVWIGGGINRYSEPAFGGRQTQQPRPSICQMLRGGFAGSGVYVGRLNNRDIVLTAKHLGAISAVRFGDGSTAQVTDAYTDRYGYDLAAFVVGPVAVAPTALGDTPQRGDVVTIAGYPGGRYGERSGPVAGYFQPQSDQPWGDMDLGFACGGPGDSGGAVLNRSGQLVGIHYGKRPGRALAVSAPAIKAFLSRVALRIGGEQPSQSPPVLPGPGPPAEPPLDPPLVPEESPYKIEWRDGDGNVVDPPKQAPPSLPPDIQFAEIDARLEKLDALIEAIPAPAECEVTAEMFGSLTASVEKLALHEHPDPECEFSEVALDALAAKVLAKLPPFPVRRQYMKLKGTPNPMVPIPEGDDRWVMYQEDVDAVSLIDGEGLTIRTFPAAPAETAEGQQ